MTNNSYPKTAALWAKLTPARRIVLHTACDILFYGKRIANDGNFHAEGSVRTADGLNENVEMLRVGTSNLFECSLTAHPEWTEVDLFRHIVGVICGEEKIGDNLKTMK